MKWANTRRGQYRTRRTRAFARYHQTTGPIVGAAGVAVGAAFASYYGGASAGAAVTAAGAGVAYAGGSYWGATAARGEGKSGREAREAGRQVGRRAAIYAGIGGGIGTLGGSLASYYGAGEGASAYNTGETAQYAGGAAEGEAGEAAAMGAGAGTTTTVEATSTAPALEAALGEKLTVENVLKGGQAIWSGYQALNPPKPDDAGGLEYFGGYGPEAMGGGGGGGGAGDPDSDPFGPPKAEKGSFLNSDAFKAGLVLLGLSLVLKG